MKINVNGFDMAYDDAGSGPPLLFIHGYPLGRAMWRPQIEALSARARVIAPDLRGHGDSSPVPGPYSMDLLADDCAALLDGLGIFEPVTVCGLSMGGYVAFAFYRRHHQRVRALVLAATRAAADSPAAREARQQAMLTARDGGVGAIAAGMLPKMFAPQTYTQSPHLVQAAREVMERTSLEGVLGDLAGLMERPDSTPTLVRIRVPALVIHGESDQIIPLAEAQSMTAGIPGGRLAVIPQAGHLLNLEQPEQFNAAILAVLPPGDL